ncbi:hypothetical protein [Limosilactobacillus reuteri]|uniref:hypothetical protein n=1 Tax=Limosilactobacillus reuteri TaxID=1598 RepID=UPI001E41FD8C|nr:hypothetical protein [Limosilactobacillus reuteri]UFK69123.1 hypothetical protein IVR12_02234 [Limosilactobacillus reuteri]
MKSNKNTLCTILIILLTIIFSLVTLYSINEWLFTYGFYYLGLLAMNGSNHKAALAVFSFVMGLAALKNIFDFIHDWHFWLNSRDQENCWKLVKSSVFQFIYMWSWIASGLLINNIPANKSFTFNTLYGKSFMLFNFFPFHQRSIIPFLLAILAFILCLGLAFIVHLEINGIKKKDNS